MTAEITRINGRWLVNNKRVQDLNFDELNFLSDFFMDEKLEFEKQLNL